MEIKTKNRRRWICIGVLVLLFCNGCSFPSIGKDIVKKIANKTKSSSENSNDGDYLEKGMNEFIKALDQKNKDVLRNCFSEYVRKNDKKLDQEIDDLFSAYPGPTDSWTWSGSSTEGFSSAPEENREHISRTAVLKCNGKHYYLYVEYTTIDLNDDGRTGLCCVDFTTPEVQAAYTNGDDDRTSYKGQYNWKGEERYRLHVTTDYKGEYQTRRIDDTELIYTPTETEASSQDFVDFVKNNRSLRDLRKRFGTENAGLEYVDKIYYKVTDGEELYVCVCIEGLEGQEVTRIKLVNEDNYIRTLFSIYE